MNLISFIVYLTILTSIVSAQFYDKGISLGIGFSSPRFMSDADGEQMNLGAHLSLQKDLNQRHSFRLYSNYGQLQSSVPNLKTTFFSIGLDYILKMHTSDVISLYLGSGFSLLYFSVDSKEPVDFNSSRFGEISANLFFGGLIDLISDDLKLKAEFKQFTVSTNDFDGIKGNNGGFFGGSLDSYIQIDLGLVYYFSKGKVYSDIGNDINIDYSKLEIPDNKEELSSISDSISALNQKINNLERKLKLNPDESFLTKYEELIKKFDKLFADKEGSLKPIYFIKSTTFPIYDSFNRLYNTLNILKNNSVENIIIEGHTDSDGDEKSNLLLSQKRAEFVRDYLISQGIDASIISIKGLGESELVNNESTEEGKMLNRRVVIKLIN